MKHNQSSNKNIQAIKHQSKKRAMAQPKYDLASILHDWKIDPSCSLAKALEYISKKANSSEEELIYLNIAIMSLAGWIYQYGDFLTFMGFPSTELVINYGLLPQEPFLKDKTLISPSELIKGWKLSYPYKRAVINIYRALFLIDDAYLDHLWTALRYLSHHRDKV
ncbi:MAG: hypothetical protein BGO76_00445 [Caedibacter sp. 38-128]|nr:hypothetical protein [Holosporales bacterium]OJX02940.1 MAG: hypothetical protein BGO76_00445 [Caedibacter sp. 38-128]